jgi:hypothetical protein
MTAQIEVARLLSNLPDGNGIRIGERRVNRLSEFVVLLDRIEERLECFEEFDAAVELAKERLIPTIKPAPREGCQLSPEFRTAQLLPVSDPSSLWGVSLSPRATYCAIPEMGRPDGSNLERRFLRFCTHLGLRDFEREYRPSGWSVGSIH